MDYRHEVFFYGGERTTRQIKGRNSEGFTDGGSFFESFHTNRYDDRDRDWEEYYEDYHYGEKKATHSWRKKAKWATKIPYRLLLRILKFITEFGCVEVNPGPDLDPL